MSEFKKDARRRRRITKAIGGKNGRRELYNYLACEILEEQPEDIKTFLLSMSVLEVLPPDLCDELLGKRNSREVLREIESKNLFLFSIEGSEDTYRYHQLFKEFLLTMLDDEERIRLLKRGCESCKRRGNPRAP